MPQRWPLYSCSSNSERWRAFVPVGVGVVLVVPELRLVLGASTPCSSSSVVAVGLLDELGHARCGDWPSCRCRIGLMMPGR